jgi:hypothetical protein
MRVLYNCPNCLTTPLVVWNGINANNIQIAKLRVIDKILTNIMMNVTSHDRYDVKYVVYVIPNCYHRECSHEASYICDCDEEDILNSATMITVDGHLPFDMYCELIDKLRLNCIFVSLRCTICLRPHQCEQDFDDYFSLSSGYNYTGSSYKVCYTNNLSV